ncbi:predicted protein [Nematostella vectensis]|uniref:ShKT domain-containing protein n=1 Tax=Nematostella vectensis TaxID=45351 RepID=A7RVH8_NEMVE|nr:uncharacterized protein LOC5516589 [Nematostella vectensis]EDO44641.1 predicted protein [Nematostella vectensis]|eukprot:XP_001636704.1 predicted protein [Nematostella vectensis]
MKVLIVLLLCVCTALAAPQTDSLIDELDKLIHHEETENDPMEELLSGVEPMNEEDKAWLAKFDAATKSSAKRGANFGRCIDGRTLADGPNGIGCAKKLCYDARVSACKGISKRICYSAYRRFREECPFSCSFCKSRSPEQGCEAAYGSRARYGCCADGFPALRPGKTDCRCEDANAHVCKQFIPKEGGCRTGSYRLRTFFQSRCLKSCGFC